MNIIRPQPGFQEKCLSVGTDVALFGGAKKASKTYTCLIDPLRHVKYSKFRGLFLRAGSKELMGSDGLWDLASQLYTPLGAKSNKMYKVFTFPSGAQIYFAHANDYNYASLQGLGATCIYFDEVTHFKEETFWWVFSALLSKIPVRPYVRMTCNPEKCWLLDWIEYYLLPSGIPNRDLLGKIRYFIRDPDTDKILWEDKREDFPLKLRDKASSFTFIPGTVQDNPIFLENNPNYVEQLSLLPEAERARMLHGCWYYTDDQDCYFKDQDFKYYIHLPYSSTFKYFYTIDTAYRSNKENDYSVCCFWGYEVDTGKLYLIDMLRGKWEYAILKINLSKFITETREQNKIESIHIETANVGAALISDLPYILNNCPDIRSMIRTKEQNKYYRANAVLGQIKKQIVHLPFPLTKGISKVFLQEVCAFSTSGRHEHDDITDNLLDAVDIIGKINYTTGNDLNLKPNSLY